MPEQVVSLARAVCRGANYCVIHCNSSSGPDFRRQIEHGLAASEIQNVRFIDSEKVAWGSSSILRVQMRAILTLLQWADDWTHHINLSGQCLPTQSMNYVEDFLFSHENTSFLELIDLDKERPDLAYRYDHYYVEVGGKPRNTYIPRPAPRHFKLCFGAFWGILSREACCYIASSNEAKRVLRYLRYAMLPDELAFQTILTNSPLRDQIDPYSRRLMLWEGHAPSPLVLTTEHWEKIDAPDILFARKFDPNIDGDVINRLGIKIGRNLSSTRSQNV
jgi:hypothetical protein